MYFRKMVGEKCYLSPICLDDTEKYTTWLNDFDVIDNLTLASFMVSFEGEKEILQRLSRDHNYAIIDIEKNELIGNVGLIGINHIHQSAEIGIFIGNKSYWNKGYGKEAISLLLDFCFKKLNLHNIFLRTYSFNENAIKLYKSVGFRKIGEIREAMRINLKLYNIVLMDILPGDFYTEYRVQSAHST